MIDMKSRLGRIGIVSGALSFSDSPRVDAAAAELDELGFGAIWVPGGLTGGVHTKVSRMLAATRRCAIATGILNIWYQPAAELGAWWRDQCADQSRVLLGLGVSHGPFIGASYAKPLTVMSDYLDALEREGIPSKNICLAALAPKMLELSRTRTAGTHPYLVPPEHSAWARERLGLDALLAPEQGVILETDPDKARAIARSNLETYLALPNYVNNWRRLGFTEEDFAGPSDRLIDALFAWGSLDQIRQRIDAHFAAGADHVALQVIQSEKVGDLEEARVSWRELADALL
jgi:probable F420-dependent oxidoreductase